MEAFKNRLKKWIPLKKRFFPQCQIFSWRNPKDKFFPNDLNISEK